MTNTITKPAIQSINSINSSKKPEQQWQATAKKYWTKETVHKICGEKDFLVTLPEHAGFLRQIGLLNEDARMERQNVKKYHQINHMLRLLEPDLKLLAKNFKTIHILDVGCGNSYLTFLLAWYFNEYQPHPCQIVGIDANPKVIAASRARAEALGWSSNIYFHEKGLDLECPPADLIRQSADDPVEGDTRFHLLVALHACDTATDAAMAYGIRQKADIIAVAPCCQAELSEKLSKVKGDNHPLASMISTPQIRREMAAHFTDLYRTVLAKSCGYQVSVTEFVASEHTPKNRLILAKRQANYLQSAVEDYNRLKELLLEQEITLRQLINMPSPG